MGKCTCNPPDEMCWVSKDDKDFIDNIVYLDRYLSSGMPKFWSKFKELEKSRLEKKLTSMKYYNLQDYDIRYHCTYMGVYTEDERLEIVRHAAQSTMTAAIEVLKFVKELRGHNDDST